MARAVDLSALKARATAPPPPAGGEPAAGGSGAIVEVTEATFQTEVLERSLQVPVVLDLWAEWCQPCKQLTPILESLATEGNGAWVLAKIDVDANPGIAQALRVQGIPAVKAVFQGQLVAEFSGALPESQVREWIGALVEAAGGALPAAGDASELPDEPEDDPALVAAESAVARGDLDGAERELQSLIDADPGNTDAQSLLLRVRLERRLAGVGPDAIERANGAPGDVDAGLAAADAEMARDQVEESFARLIALVRRTAGDERGRVRERLVELFSLVGDSDPRVVTARRDLTSALF
ncbi:MAG TPA: tetratricopeptide repeat protein [Mycobacteriales bacterium]|nr:tetratricopeptide repeat protein [Mycobacteriales bacterium]